MDMETRERETFPVAQVNHTLSQEALDRQYMALACDLAMQCEPIDQAYCVGAVITRQGQIISTGFSRELPGNTHAEQCALIKLQEKVNSSSLSDLGGHLQREGENTALQSLELSSQSTELSQLGSLDLSGCTLYSTMEPCSTRLSKQIPCANRIITAGISRVVVAVREPDKFVVCEGLELLQRNGVLVEHLEGYEEMAMLPNRHLF